MTIQTIDRPRGRYGRESRNPRLRLQMAANVLIREGAIVVMDGGYAKEGFQGPGLKVIGPAAERANNLGGSAGAKFVEVFEGDFPVDNSAGADELTEADLGQDVFLVDNNTGAKTDDTGDRSLAGRLVGFFEDGRPLVRFAASEAA